MFLALKWNFQAKFFLAIGPHQKTSISKGITVMLNIYPNDINASLSEFSPKLGW